MAYYDFWPGHWVRIVDGRPDTKASSFAVRRSVHAAAFEEEWRLVSETGKVSTSRAFRAWDQVGRRWMFAWISDNALFQVWEGARSMIVGTSFGSSRSMASASCPGRLGGQSVAIVWFESASARSTVGATWQPRFREEYVRSVPR